MSDEPVPEAAAPTPTWFDHLGQLIAQFPVDGLATLDIPGVHIGSADEGQPAGLLLATTTSVTRVPRSMPSKAGEPRQHPSGVGALN